MIQQEQIESDGVISFGNYPVGLYCVVSDKREPHYEGEHDWFSQSLFRGIHYKYPLCCIIWFSYGWQVLQSILPDDFFHGEYFPNEKRILCPDCMVRSLIKDGKI